MAIQMVSTAIITRIERIWHRNTGQFVRNVAVVAGGTGLAQFIGVIFSPIITRLYGPDAYGALGVFLSVVAIGASIATLGYSFSIVLPKRDATAYQLLKLSCLIACVISITTAVLIKLFQEPVVESFNLEVIASYLWLVPFVIFLTAILQALEQWQVRIGGFKSLATAAIIQASSAGGMRAGAGLVAPTATALIVFGMLAKLFQVSILYLAGRQHIKSAQSSSANSRQRKKAALYAVARRFRDFPLYRAPQVLLNTISRAAPTILLASLFGTGAAGLYVIAQSVLYLPVALIAQSVGKVFLQRLAEEAHNKKPLQPMILRATGGLILIGLFPFGFIAISGPWLFELIFGADWHEAGTYARWLTVWVFFHFINIPSVQSLALSKSQDALLAWEIITTTSKIILLLSIGHLTNNPEFTIAMYAIFGAAAYIVLILIGIIRAGDNTRIRYA